MYRKYVLFILSWKINDTMNEINLIIVRMGLQTKLGHAQQAHDAGSTLFQHWFNVFVLPAEKLLNIMMNMMINEMN